MPWSTAIDNAILDHVTGKATWTAPAAFYVGLSSTPPTKAGANVTEPSGNGYARIQVTAAQFASAASSATTTNTDKSFPTATGDWLSAADLTHAVFYDASSGGNFLGFKALTTARKVQNGDTFRIPAGDLDLAMGGT